ncbi:MAG: TrkH family potassium uptake protein [Lachnospiraceae bacterium]|nr:TrkH family potassium uptake protein [Lachnospiraceae bacterium]
MDPYVVIYVIGWVLQFEAVFLLVPVLVGLGYRETRFALLYLAVAAVCLITGTVLKLSKNRKKELYIREGFASVALAWVFLSIFGAIPFVLTGEIPSFTNALFETISGFTKTGASILSEVESLSHISLFWRSFTHWLGGMGVFMLILAVLPMLGDHSINLMRAESAGPSVEKLFPKVRDTALLTYSLYVLLTILGTVSLVISGLNLFDSSTLMFGTVGTGGFSVYNDSVVSLAPAQQWIIAIFMTLGAVNYTAYYYLILRRFRAILDFEEIWVYFGMIIVATLLIAGNIHGYYPSAGETFRHSYFMVTSIMSTSGFATTDFNNWPAFSKSIMLILMLIGGCAGSTAGGFKISRLVILIKAIRKEFRSLIHPEEHKKIYINKETLSAETLRSVNSFAALYFVTLFISILLISIGNNFDFMTLFSSASTCMNCVGIAFEKTGYGCNFDIYSGFAKYVLMLDMIAGRLEFFPLLALFFPSCWRKY